jgi:hypothetical protein
MATTAVTSGNIITITDDLAIDGVNQSPKVIVRAKKNVYSNITGTETAPVLSLIDHQGNVIFTKTFASNGTQASVTHSINGQVTLSTMISSFNTWNGGVGVKNLQNERVYLARLTHNTNQAPTYTVVKNTTGYDVKFGAPSTGVYKFTHTNTFDATKAIYLAGGAAVGCDVNINADATDVILTTNGSAGTGSNTVLSNTSVSIRVQH